MNQSNCIVRLGLAASVLMAGNVDHANAATGRIPGPHIVKYGLESDHRQRDSKEDDIPLQPADTQGFAQVTFSRAADHDGRPVYFSSSSSAGSAGLVSFSSRRLPARAVFSVALVTSRPSRPSPRFLGSLPSLMPVAARGLTSGFGMRQHPLLGTMRVHSGIDLAASYGSPIVATSDGVVGTANWSGGYGLLVALDHGNGLQTRYGHMSRLNVVQGQQVHKGDVIGYVGSTGMSTGPHLHYEIRINGQAINPAAQLHGR